MSFVTKAILNDATFEDVARVASSNICYFCQKAFIGLKLVVCIDKELLVSFLIVFQALTFGVLLLPLVSPPFLGESLLIFIL